MKSRGSPSSLPFRNLSSWFSWNKNFALPHPKHYATESPKHNGGKPSLIHVLALEFSSWVHDSHRDPAPPQPAQRCVTDRWVHYTALGLWRYASQDQIKQRYYELSREHHPDVSQDPNSPEIFKRAAEAYAVLGKKKLRRKYDQEEQLHSAILTGLRDQLPGELSSSSPRPLDPTFWNPIRSGSSTTFYRPPPGYWTAMNRITRAREKEKEKLQTQAASPSPQKAMPSHDRPETERLLGRFEVGLIVLIFMASAMEYMD